MRVKNTKITYNPGSTESDLGIELLIKNINIWYNFNYKLESNPSYFTDDGTGIFMLKNMTLKARYLVKLQDNKF